jgi:hypothetical protein
VQATVRFTCSCRVLRIFRSTTGHSVRPYQGPLTGRTERAPGGVVSSTARPVSDQQANGSDSQQLAIIRTIPPDQTYLTLATSRPFVCLPRSSTLLSLLPPSPSPSPQHHHPPIPPILLSCLISIDISHYTFQESAVKIVGCRPSKREKRSRAPPPSFIDQASYQEHEARVDTARTPNSQLHPVITTSSPVSRVRADSDIEGSRERDLRLIPWSRAGCRSSVVKRVKIGQDGRRNNQVSASPPISPRL